MTAQSALHTALDGVTAPVQSAVVPLGIEIDIPIGLRELSKLPPSILLVMVVVGVALGLALLYAKVK